MTPVFFALYRPSENLRSGENFTELPVAHPAWFRGIWRREVHDLLRMDRLLREFPTGCRNVWRLTRKRRCKTPF